MEGTAGSGTVFSSLELSELNGEPFDHVMRLVASGDHDGATARFGAIVRAHQRSVDGFRVWLTSIESFASDQLMPGRDSLVEDALSSSAAKHPELYGILDSATVSWRHVLEYDSGAIDFIERAKASITLLQAEHELWVDAVTVALGMVMDQAGISGLETCLRRTGDETLFRWMPTDVSRDLRTRAIVWTNLLRGNFASVTVSEEPGKVVITQDPCGTCVRQINDGLYSDGWLRLVEDRHPLTLNRGGEPIYRTHVALMHDIVPRERIGSSWPAFSCPLGLDPGPCQVTLLDRDSMT